MFTVTPHCQIIAQLGLKDSSCNLQANCVIIFYLILQVNCVIVFLFNTLCMYPNIRCDR